MQPAANNAENKTVSKTENPVFYDVKDRIKPAVKTESTINNGKLKKVP